MMAEKAFSSKNILLLSSLIFICFLVYFSSLSNGFTNLDDQVQVVQNTSIKTFQLLDIFQSTSVGMYQPVSSLFYALTYQLGGLNAKAFHLLSLLFHCFNILLLFSLFKKISFSNPIALIACSIFALHPMQVESVAWVSAFSTLCFTSFLLLALLNYFKYNENQKKSSIILSYLFFILACFAKSAAIIFPILLICIDWFYYERRTIKVIWTKLIFFAVSVTFGIITLFSRESAGHLSDLSISFGLFDRFFLICHSILFYPFKFIFPNQLSAFYAYPPLTEGFLPIDYYLSPAVLLVIVGFFWKFKPHKLIWFGTSFYLVGIALVLQFIPVGNQVTTDRYIYLPMIGLLIILSHLISRIKQVNIKYAFIILPIVLSFISFERTKVWESDQRIWTDVIEKNPRVAQAHNNLGSYYVQQGDAKKALAFFNEAITLKPYYADAFSNRGSLHSQMGKSKEAMQDFNRAIKLRAHADAYFNRANELVKAKDLNSAILDYNESIKLAKRADVYTNRAFANAQLGNLELAFSDLKTAIKINANYGQAYFLYGMMLNSQGNKQLACQHLNRAMKLKHVKAKQAWEQLCKKGV